MIGQPTPGVGMRILVWILSGGKKGFGELSAYFVASAFSHIPIEKLDAPKLQCGKNVDLIMGFRGNVLLCLYDAWGRRSVVVAGSCDVLLGYSEVSGYDIFISELLVNFELRRLVAYQVTMDLVGALRLWASREII